ncbi:MAG: hypothetical protein CXZ00_03330 [Acidobacteria bacterium]|nr:MAG: hypothetical protein CXZ00_03330 [Acidobacteriota bacterium]
MRLTKRDLLFVAERLASLLDENRVAVLARQHGIKSAKESESSAKLFPAFLRRSEESTLGRIVVESIILLAASRGNASQVLREAATAYKVDTEAIAAKVKQEFTAKEKTKEAKKATAKPNGKANKKAAA